MTNEMTEEQPVCRVITIKDGINVELVWREFLNKIADNPPLRDEDKRVIAIIQTPKGPVEIRGHAFSKDKFNAVIGQAGKRYAHLVKEV